VQPIRFDFNNMMAGAVGEEGVRESDIREVEEKIPELHRRLVAGRRSGKDGFFDLPYDTALLDKINVAADWIKSEFDNFVVLGIGGSALGTIALVSALKHPFYNELSKEERGGTPKIYVADNIDPDRFKSMLGRLDPKKTLFNVITKSGGTAETMAEFLIIRDLLKERIGKGYERRVIATTSEHKGNLVKIAREENYELFFIPENVGGRFSVFTPVGLLPAAAVGIEIKTLLEGAAEMDKRTNTDKLWENPAYMNSVLQYILDTKKGKSISVLMPYSSALRDIADWFRQLWAESLGKKNSLDGQVVHVGVTPVKALGVTDQHSQIQLYVEGPNNKVITFIAVEKFKETVSIPSAFSEIEGVSYLGGRTLNELMEAERTGTELALTQALRPNGTIIVPEINEAAVGQLLYMFEVQTALSGLLYNVDAFNQPGVEAGKNAAYAQMGRAGFEKKRKEIESRPPKNDKYII